MTPGDVNLDAVSRSLLVRADRAEQRARDAYALAASLAAQLGMPVCPCHQLPIVLGNRCPVSKHRVAIGGVPPRQTRDLMRAQPRRAVGIAVRELAGRAAARRAGRRTA